MNRDDAHAPSEAEWIAQFRLAQSALRDARPLPAVAFEVSGRLTGRHGQAVPLLLMARRMAAECGLRQQASLCGRVLTIRFSDPRAHSDGLLTPASQPLAPS